MEPQLLQQLCDEYTLGLLEGQEHGQLTGLLEAGDPAALKQLRESEELLAALALALPAAEPPALVRSQLVNRVRGEEREAQRQAEARQQASPRAGQPASAAGGRGWALGWAVAAALAVASLYSYFALRAASDELRRTEGQLASVRGEAARTRRILDVVLARDTRYIKLSTSPNEPQFRAFFGGAAGLVLTGVDVPAAKAGRTFQLWVVPKSGNPVSAGVFAPGANGQVLYVAETKMAPGDAAAIAISDEPEGGSPQPTTKPVFVGTVGD